MRERLIKTVRRDLILDTHVRYGLARNVPATDEQGRDCLICLAIIERDNGMFETVGINEERIRFQGEGVIKEEVMRKVYV